MNNILWLIQDNINPIELGQLENSFKELGFQYKTIKVIPFSNEIPKVEFDGHIIFYGSTNLTNMATEKNYWKSGLFFDNNKFRYSNYIKKYKSLMLNYDSEIVKLRDVINTKTFVDNGKFFIRPNRDIKEFAGTIMKSDECFNWVNRLINNDLTDFLDIETVISKVKLIKKEYRIFIVDKKYSSGSQYRQDGMLCLDDDVPEDVIKFSESCAQIYSPSGIYVMDICEVGGILYILEINCFNNSGFYKSDKKKIIEDVSKYVWNIQLNTIY